MKIDDWGSIFNAVENELIIQSAKSRLLHAMEIDDNPAGSCIPELIDEIGDWKSIFDAGEDQFLIESVRSRLLHAMKINNSPTGRDILEIMKEKLKEKDESTYKEWKVKEFDIDYTFHLGDCAKQRDSRDYYKSFGFTLLHFGAYYRCEAVVGLLLSKNANIEGLDEAGRRNEDIRRENMRISGGRLLIPDPPIHYPVRLEDIRMEDMRIPEGRLLIPTPRTHSPLHLAARGGNLGVVNTLIENGANVNALDRDSATPLYLAAQCGHARVVYALIKKGADVEALDRDSRHPSDNRFSYAREVHESRKNGVEVNTLHQGSATHSCYLYEGRFFKILQCLEKAEISISNSIKETPPPLPPRSENSRRRFSKIPECLQKPERSISTSIRETPPPLPPRSENSRELSNTGSCVDINGKNNEDIKNLRKAAIQNIGEGGCKSRESSREVPGSFKTSVDIECAAKKNNRRA
ncbi:ankyrin repeat domain-containing protein [Wolbachia endosymbiont of Oedothorax gibbosus]|uniref:ankyrin repeat domain-containing protein n=1 Tax=Wolbachia endosymbiont of Oedothorax gibbosus TaxID=931100 RepID=UPI002024AE94|nr:ankyrin repeat domain-containing protein [Wolbachia endosymbiont of Oedothorax gibbosus]